MKFSTHDNISLKQTQALSIQARHAFFTYSSTHYFCINIHDIFFLYVYTKFIRCIYVIWNYLLDLNLEDKHFSELLGFSKISKTMFEHTVQAHTTRLVFLLIWWRERALNLNFERPKESRVLTSAVYYPLAIFCLALFRDARRILKTHKRHARTMK